MPYTFLSASYANPDHTAALAVTAEVAAKIVSAKDTPEAWEALHASGVAIGPYVPLPAPLRTELYKTEIIERMTDAELEVFDAELSAAPLRKRLMWRDCVTVLATSPLFAELRGGMTVSFGAERAEAILSLAP